MFIDSTVSITSKMIVDAQGSVEFIANTYPVKYEETTGLPCRAVTKI